MDTALHLGRSVDCSFGPFVPNLTFETPQTLGLAIPTPNGIDRQEVEIAPITLRDDLLMLSWTERDGTVVVHVHDYRAMVVHSHARLTDGTLVRAAGTLRWTS